MFLPISSFNITRATPHDWPLPVCVFRGILACPSIVSRQRKRCAAKARCALAPYRPRVVVRRTAPRPTSTTHESLTVLCGCRLLLVAEGRVGALKECQNQEWPSDTFSEMPLPLVPSAHRSNHYDNELGTQGSNNPKITQNSVKWRFGPKISSPAARIEGLPWT